MPSSRKLGREHGAALKLLRDRLDWPQKQLAAAAGVTTSMISDYETGKRDPTLVTFFKLLRALGADLCDFHCALAINAGKPINVHELSPRFQLGPEGLSRPPGRSAREARSAAGAGSREAGGTTTDQPQLAAELEPDWQGVAAGLFRMLLTISNWLDRRH